MKIKFKSFLENFVNSPKAVFFGLTIIITLPMWQKGYLFLLDWGVTDIDGLKYLDFWQQSVALMSVAIFSSIINFGLYQKLVFVILFFFLGLGGYLFVKEIIITTNFQAKRNIKEWGKYIGGMLMIINPFIYARAVDGQWLVVVSVLGLLYMTIYLWRWKRLQEGRDLVIAVVFAVLTVLFSQHAIFFVLELNCIFFGLLWIERGDYKIMKWWVVIIGCVLLANINVIIGYLFNLSESSRLVSQFDEAHLHVFRTIKNGYASIYTNVLSLHGYWGEGEGRFLSTQEHPFIWQPIFFILFSVSMMGAWLGRKKVIIKFLILSGGIAYILAMGIESIFAPISKFLYEYMPFYIGLREPHKWTGVLLICIVGLVSYGALQIMKQQSKNVYVHISGLFFIGVILLYTPTMFWGLRGQIIPQDFPSEWYEVRSRIGCNKIDGKILFLPWHQYMKIDFLNNKKIVNPAKGFFGACVIQGDNMEADNIYTQKFSMETQIISKYIISSNLTSNDFASDMKNMSVKYVILSKSEDFTKYEWLNKISTLKMVYNGNWLVVYELN